MDQSEQSPKINVVGVLKSNKKIIFWAVISILLLTILIIIIIALNVDNEKTVKNTYLAGSIVLSMLAGFMSIMFYRCREETRDNELKMANKELEQSRQLSQQLSEANESSQQLRQQLSDATSKLINAQSEIENLKSMAAEARSSSRQLNSSLGSSLSESNSIPLPPPPPMSL